MKNDDMDRRIEILGICDGEKFANAAEIRDYLDAEGEDDNGLVDYMVANGIWIKC